MGGVSPFSYSYGAHRDLHSFRTRRSSDLLQSRSDLVCRLLLVTGVDRKSTRLNSSHDQISYAVFSLKKKNRSRAWRSQRCRMCKQELRTLLSSPRLVSVIP